ncbi:unnamed protein product [Effrenium voratum]|nr:unnamed protein product [Effrenium voratum]
MSAGRRQAMEGNARGARAATATREPAIGDRILVLRQPWLDDVLGGKKTMELRSCRVRHGFAWLGATGQVWGGVTISAARKLSQEEFEATREQHRWPAQKPAPYGDRLCGMTLTGVFRLPQPVPYWRPSTAIGFNVFRRGPEDARAKPAATKRSAPAKPTRKTKKPAVSETPAQAPPLPERSIGPEDEEETLPMESMGGETLRRSRAVEDLSEIVST